MKKIALFFLNLLFAAMSISAQNPKVMLYLKNGTVIKGKLFETGSPETVKIKSGNNVWVFPFSDIESIDYKVKDKNKEITNDPFYFKVNAGLLLGNSTNAETEISFFHSSFNYRLAEKFYTGAGVGVEYYMEQSYIPTFLNFEYKFRQTRSFPHLYLKTGYIIPGEKQQTSAEYDQFESRNVPPKFLNAHGGVLVNPGFGFTSMPGENFGLCFSVGYRYHALNFSGKDEYELEQRYNRLCLSLSIVFK